MNVLNLLEAIAPNTEVVIKNENDEIVLKWEQGYDLKALDTIFKYKIINLLRVEGYKKLEVVVGGTVGSTN